MAATVRGSSSIANARAFEEINTLHEQPKQENDYLRAEVNEEVGGLLGQSPALRMILSQIELVAPTEASVLNYSRVPARVTSLPYGCVFPLAASAEQFPLRLRASEH
jgi:hypothetical protein